MTQLAYSIFLEDSNLDEDSHNHHCNSKIQVPSREHGSAMLKATAHSNQYLYLLFKFLGTTATTCTTLKCKIDLLADASVTYLSFL